MCPAPPASDPATPVAAPVLPAQVAASASGGHVRLTLAGEDVELERGARLGALRPRLAEVLGRTELLGVPLAVGAKVLDDDALVGFGPLVPGADVRVHAPRRRPAAPDDDLVSRAQDALGAPARWEVVAGPGAGRVEADVERATGERVVEVRGRRVRNDDAARLVRVRRVRRARGPSVVLARDHGRGRPARLGLRRRRVRDGDVVRVGATVVRRVVVEVAAARADVAAEDARPRRLRGFGPGMSMTTLVLPLVSAAMLAVMTSRPAFALVGLVGPLVLGVTALVRRARRTPPPAAEPPTTWAGLAVSPVDLTTRIVTGDLGSPATPGPRALAVTGPDVGPRVRVSALAFAALHPGAPVTVVGGDARAWEWARWLGARVADHPAPSAPTPGAASPGVGTDDGTRLVVVMLAAPDDLRRTSEWWAHTGPGTHVLLVAPASLAPARSAEGRTTPSRTEPRRTASALAAPTWCEGDVDGPGVGADLADALARELAPHVAHAAGAALAPTVPLADLVGLDTASPADKLARAVAARWTRAPARPVAPVGRLADGSGAPCVVDLVRDGPHGLVAGTTGAGKSELLQTLVLSLALTHPPSRLAFVLLDHKGGAGFGPCLALPHVAGVATDLEPGSARRALAALRAELRSREELLADHGVADVEGLAARAPSLCPPRLLVVVDELRALADDDPGLVPSFLRIAAQGRSLGLHLVLATQRPAGTVSADVRANVGLRVALRVASDADSRDVVDVPDAAALPASSPGLAIVVTSRTAQRTVRCALASAPSTPASARVRRVPRSPGPARSAAPSWGDDVAARLVAAADAAVHVSGGTRSTPLWEPPLPLRCMSADAPACAADALPVALLDEPDLRRRGVAAWEPARGHLHVEGAPGSGRSTVLHALALEAAARGWHVHVLGPDPLVTVMPGAVPSVTGPPTTGPTGAASSSLPAWFGTHASATDPRRAHALLARLLASPPEVRTLVLVDGVEELLGALGRVGRGAGAETLVALARQPAAHGVRLALASARSLTGQLAAALGPRLVLTGTDRAGDLARGVPSELAGLGGPPGRGVWTGAGPARLAQAFGPGAVPPATPGTPATGLRLHPVPTSADGVALAALADAFAAAPHAGLAPLGHGGDDAGPRLLDVTRDVLVVGPPGSGRTSVLGRLAAHAARLGPVLVVGACPALGSHVGGPQADGSSTVVGSSPTSARQDDGAVIDAGAGRAPAIPDDNVVVVPVTPEGLARVPAVVEGGAWTLVVDDVDVLARLLPAEHDRAASIPGVARCLVAATTAAATLASRGLLGRVRAGRHGVVLDPGRPGSADALATDVADVIEPGPARPGRGALVADGRVELVQCLAPDAEVGPLSGGP